MRSDTWSRVLVDVDGVCANLVVLPGGCIVADCVELGCAAVGGATVADGDGFFASCAWAVSVISKQAASIQFQLRITQSSLFRQHSILAKFSVRQLENHVYDCRGIHRHAVALSRFESHLASGG